MLPQFDIITFIITFNAHYLFFCFFVECTWSDAPVSSALKYLKERFPECDAFQISATGKKDFIDPQGIRVCPAEVFLKTLI